tara:strand:+ start:1123 stop:1686 length:564 start_codon:yes stop_codon:yes gene_type:complete
MKRDQIIEIQAKIGTVPDGFWGNKSIAACQKYLINLGTGKDAPDTDQASLTRAYGAAGDESRLVNLNVAGLGVKYDGAAVKTIRCNSAVARSLLAIVTELSTFQEGQEALSQYAGVYNNRKMRGGSLPSLHARGAAIDLMPGTNANRQSWPASADMPFKVIETFAKHGWLSAGVFWSRDAMHFQKTI